MKETIKTNDALTTCKTVYEKPTSKVYELEVERAILGDSNTESLVPSSDSVWDIESE